MRRRRGSENFADDRYVITVNYGQQGYTVSRPWRWWAYWRADSIFTEAEGAAVRVKVIDLKTGKVLRDYGADSGFK